MGFGSDLGVRFGSQIWGQIWGSNLGVKSKLMCQMTLFPTTLNNQGLFQTFVGCHYCNQSSALCFEKTFSLEMVKNDICLGGARKLNAIFFQKSTLKKMHPCPQCTEQALKTVWAPKYTFQYLLHKKSCVQTKPSICPSMSSIFL